MPTNFSKTCFVIKQGPNFYKTLASIKFDYWGDPTNAKIFTVENWHELYDEYITFDTIIFCSAGVVFDNIKKFIENIPEFVFTQGHIIEKNNQLFLHSQCFVVNGWKPPKEIFTNETLELKVYNYQKSNSNIHDDYTPTWVRKTNEKSLTKINSVFDKLLWHNFDLHEYVVNFSKSQRQHKKFLYDDTEDLFAEYNNLAQNSLWILNNEPNFMWKHKEFVGPASGTMWLLQCCNPVVESINLIDISKAQVNFAKKLLDWNGKDYGQLAYDYIINSMNKHFHFDKTLSDKERLEYMLDKNSFVEYVNQIFYAILPKDFESLWKNKKTKIKITHGNLLEHYKIDQTVWLSNILNYKYTLVNSNERCLKQLI